MLVEEPKLAKTAAWPASTSRDREARASIRSTRFSIWPSRKT